MLHQLAAAAPPAQNFCVFFFFLHLLSYNKIISVTLGEYFENILIEVFHGFS